MEAKVETRKRRKVQGSKKDDRNEVESREPKRERERERDDGNLFLRERKAEQTVTRLNHELAAETLEIHDRLPLI